jgi:uncharacterized heparinase superfamily protein
LLGLAGAESDQWRANPFHRMRLGEIACDSILAYADDARVGDAQRGREIAGGTWRIGAERIPGEHASPWTRPAPSRHFAARLHSFSWLADLAAIGPSTETYIAYLIDQWVARFGAWDDLAWDPELTAERLYAWLAWGRPAFEQADPASRNALFLTAARQARLLLLSHNELSERHSGAIKAGAALVLAGAAGFPDADRLLEQGEEMLFEAYAKQFLPDGGHQSRCPEILAEAFYDFLAAETALQQLGASSFQDITTKFANMLRLLQLSDGALGCFHGGAEGSPASLAAGLARVPEAVRPFQFATHSAFQRLEVGDMRVLFDVGGAPAPAYAERAHASALAFEMSSGRERIIVNVGAGRDLAPAARMAARATNGHSTLVISDALSAGLDNPRRAKGPARLIGPDLDDVRRSADDSGITVQGRHDGYKSQFGLLHRRYLFADHNGRNLRGIDELIRPIKLKSPNPKHPIPFVARFHLHPAVRVRLIEKQMALLETPRGQRWRLRTDAPKVGLAPSIYWGGTDQVETTQIVLEGEADPMGHGLGPPNRIRWAMSRAD